MKKLLIVFSILTVFLSVAWFGFISPMYGEYGGSRVRGAIGSYIDNNDGKWPSSWDDIDPYHRDIFGLSTSYFVRLHWDVYWDIDVNEVREFSMNMEDRNMNSQEDGTPLIYRKSEVPDPSLVNDWYFVDHVLPAEVEK